MKFLTCLLVALATTSHAAAQTCDESGLTGEIQHYGYSSTIFDESTEALASDEYAYFIPEVFCKAVPDSFVTMLMSDAAQESDGTYYFEESSDAFSYNGILPAGKYNSFLIHSFVGERRPNFFEFTVEFCEPIVGIIASNTADYNELDASDDLFGMSNSTYGGLVSARKFEINNGDAYNWIRVSEDRKYMTVNMRVVHKIDDIRVITACGGDGCDRRLEESSLALGDHRKLDTAVCPVPVTNKNSDVTYDDAMAKKWGIIDPAFAYDSLSFALCYGVSDMIDESMAQYEIFASDCKTPLSDPNALTVTDNLSGSLGVGDAKGDGDRQHELSISLETENIQQTNIYLNHGGGDAQVQFCLRNQLFITDLDKEINYLETIVTLTVKMKDCFKLDEFNVAPNEKDTQEAADAFNLEGYLCDGDNIEYPDAGEEVAPASFSQGEMIRVCVRPNEEARDNEIYMRYIDSLQFTLDGGAPIQDAVVGPNEASPLGLSQVYCESGDDVCAVETILFATFYESDSFVDISGSAVMQFGSTPLALQRRRYLKSGRNLQEDQSEASSKEFDVQAGISKASDEFRSASGSNPTQAVSFLGCLLAGAALFI